MKFWVFCCELSPKCESPYEAFDEFWGKRAIGRSGKWAIAYTPLRYDSSTCSRHVSVCVDAVSTAVSTAASTAISTDKHHINQP